MVEDNTNINDLVIDDGQDIPSPSDLVFGGDTQDDVTDNIEEGGQDGVETTTNS
jgi:hypothetical protein